LRALVDTILLADLLLKTPKLLSSSAAAATGCCEILLELHAADLLLAHLGHSASGCHGGKRECDQAWTADRPHRRRKTAPNQAIDAHD